MAMINDPSRLNLRISFGTGQSTENGNSIPIETYVESFSVWCGVWNRTYAEKFAAIGTEHQNDLTVIIRHNPAVNQSLLAQMVSDLSTTYRVVDVAPDETPSPVSFDLVTMQKVNY